MNLTDAKLLTETEVKPMTPEIVAELFADMDSEGQAAFFNHVAEVASKWQEHGGGGISMQLQHITDEDGLSLAGRRVMQGIGDYSHWGLVPRAES